MTLDPTSPALTRGPVRVVGTGLLGGSIGLAMSARGVDVLLSDPSPTAMALARDMGAGRVHAEVPDAAEPALVVVAAPPDVVADVVAAELQRWPGAVVTDVASVKGEPLRELRERGADLARYAGGHPMAGRERSGAVSARGDIFAGRPWAITAAPETEAAAVEAVRALALDCGAMPVEMPPEQHDVAVALVSHTPQVAASLVAARLREAPDVAVGLAGQGLRDVTRIAASDPALWVQILTGNAGPVAAVLRALRDDLDQVIGALEALAEDPAAPGARGLLARAIADGGLGRDRIPGKHGSAPTRYAPVLVVVPDAPGELARLLTDVGEEGVSVEDLRLEHSPGQRVALAEIAVLPAAAERLQHALRARGWTVPE
ncbi:prephenate dehydrogenase [Kineococcus xinjiangensis]|uniref:Prephenate dehydrogenase n=1 Tax=Kineococcus xinjiangensis TaxID=512762 RepID=A0A2S6IC76_9ACTN|nr:prephenate dehydrogenase [Kineococcus xinjiangensis]PPK90852.1 prephenate dehydrogenase [Kineococcus xinjiangensis]